MNESHKLFGAQSTGNKLYMVNIERISEFENRLIEKNRPSVLRHWRQEKVQMCNAETDTKHTILSHDTTLELLQQSSNQLQSSEKQ